MAKGEAKLGNYEKAANWGELALERYEYRGDSLLQATVHSVLSGYYTHLNKHELADIHNNLALQISKKSISNQTEATALNQQGLSLYEKEQYHAADSVFLQALLQIRKSGRSSSTDYANVLCNRALCQNKLNNTRDAISLTCKALDLKTSILGQEHGDNVILLFNLAMYYHQLGQMDSVADYYHRAITLQTQQVRNNFSFQSTRQREQFWQGKRYIYQTAPLFATTPDQAPAELLADIYNAQLFTKGILLNSEIDFRRLLQKSGDKKILTQYDELQVLRAELQQYYEVKSGENKNNIQDLQRRIGQLEYAVVRQCKAYGDFTQNLSLTSDSVRRALRPDEAAVEFFEADITYGGQPDQLYLALILRPEWETPHACRLFFRSDMEKLGYPVGKSISELLRKKEWQNKIYNDNKLEQLVWGELLANIDGASHIYFAPSGIFYQWGIEYMPYDSAKNTRISDTLSVSRLSSTKLIAQRNDAPNVFGEGTAVIYGGLEYENMSIEQMHEYHNMGDDEVTDDDEDFLAMYAFEQQKEDSLAIRAMVERGDAVKNLQGTKKEVDDIEQLLYNAGRKYTSYKGFSGTEESFKRLNSRDISILHIATHGFSYYVEDSAEHDWLKPSISSSAKPIDPLCYSGLLFSGCNNKLLHPQDFPPDIDDGILTAQEIAQLNLQNLQLTVLSACQTGTGMLQEDGVFGVQRGFKKAGAHTLVMSLWNVDDAATQLMMTSFYEALLNERLSLHDAFKKAQEAVRKEHPEPHYWAPFIMLDDI